MPHSSLTTAHCTPHIGSGGLGQSVPKLCAALAARGNTVRLHVLEPAAENAPAGVELLKYPRSRPLQALGISKSLKRAIRSEGAGRADVLHAHSLWTMAGIYPGSAAREKCRYVHSPRGTLAAWALAHHKWRKRLMWPLQRRALARADCFHVTSEKELDDVRRLGFSNRAAIIHNGIALPPLGLAAVAGGAPRRLLFLGRVHPVKALDRLLQSWKILQVRFADWELTIAGEDDGGYLPKIKTLSKELNLERVTFPGLVRESERDALYQSADLFVLPSHTENFGIAAAEALANGVPAVVSKFAPWKNLEREGCGWWTGTQPEVLADCLAGAMSLPRENLAAMGARGRAWMARDFSWERAAEMMENTYTWLLGGGDAPGWVN